MSLHGKKGLGKKDRKGWCCDKILIHLKEFAPTRAKLIFKSSSICQSLNPKLFLNVSYKEDEHKYMDNAK